MQSSWVLFDQSFYNLYLLYQRLQYIGMFHTSNISSFKITIGKDRSGSIVLILFVSHSREFLIHYVSTVVISIGISGL